MKARFARVVVYTPTILYIGTTLALITLQGRLPHPVATHFTHGRPDESSRLWSTVAENLLLSAAAWLVLGTLAWLRPDGSIGRRAAAGLTLFVIVLLNTSMLLGVVAANLDARVWHDAASPAHTPAIALGTALVAFTFGALAVSPLRRSADDSPDMPSDPVGGGRRNGRTIWIGRSRNPAFYWKTLAATALMSGMVLAGMIWMIVPTVLSLTTLHLWSGITAVFDGTTLIVRGRLPLFPMRRIRLRHIETAEMIEVDPRNWGWGWRLRSLRRHAVVVREGEGLLVALRGGGEFIVTVDDAAVGAEEIRRALRDEPPATNHASSERSTAWLQRWRALQLWVIRS